MYPVYCINLNDRPDRKKHSLNEFNKLFNLNKTKINYPYFVKHKKGGLCGVYNSHMTIWEDFYKNYPNNNYCLVFEDDFLVTSKTKKILKKAEKFIQLNNENIDILFLHNKCILSKSEINNDLFTNGWGILAHAYFVSRPYIASIIKKHKEIPKELDQVMHFDVLMSHDKNFCLYSNKIYYTKVPCVTQIVSDSDNITSGTIAKLIHLLSKSDSNTFADFYLKLLKPFRFIDHNVLKKMGLDMVKSYMDM